jgi:hypothetical protein
MEGDEPEVLTVEEANIKALPEPLAEIMSTPAVPALEPELAE